MELSKTMENLLARGYEVSRFRTAAEAADYLNRTIDGTTVGIGGSMTVQHMGLAERLRTHNTVWWHWLPNQKEQYGVAAVRSKAINAEVYLCSVNALAETGELVNIDASGNRISSMAYGHRRLLLVVGHNKLTPTLEQAIWRARNVAAPKNAQRMGLKTPCAVKGDRCYNCSSPDRICRGLLILERPMKGVETEILLVDEDLGA